MAIHKTVFFFCSPDMLQLLWISCIFLQFTPLESVKTKSIGVTKNKEELESRKLVWNAIIDYRNISITKYKTRETESQTKIYLNHVRKNSNLKQRISKESLKIYFRKQKYIHIFKHDGRFCLRLLKNEMENLLRADLYTNLNNKNKSRESQKIKENTKKMLDEKYFTHFLFNFFLKTDSLKV